MSMEVLFMARKKEFKDVRQLLAENLEKAYERWDLLYKTHHLTVYKK